MNKNMKYKKKKNLHAKSADVCSLRKQIKQRNLCEEIKRETVIYVRACERRKKNVSMTL